MYRCFTPNTFEKQMALSKKNRVLYPGSVSATVSLIYTWLTGIFNNNDDVVISDVENFFGEQKNSDPGVWTTLKNNQQGNFPQKIIAVNLNIFILPSFLLIFLINGFYSETSARDQHRTSSLKWEINYYVINIACHGHIRHN